MPMSKNDGLHDAVQTMMAMSHHIQNMLVQSASNGWMPNNICQEIARMAQHIARQAERMETKK